jgi:surface protein
MKHFSNQSNGSHVGRMNYGGAKFCRFALFPLMLLMLLLLPANMVAQKAASSSKYIATYESSTNTLTFKKNVGETLPKNSAWVEDKMTVATIKNKLGNGTIVHIVFDKSFSTYTPTSLYRFFENLEKLETITGLEYLNTEKVTDMRYMFNKCSELTSLDVTNFNTAKVTDMSYMFSSCKSLTSLDVTKFDTRNVTTMEGMFSFCSKLPSLDVTNFNTVNVNNMMRMFAGCNALTSLDVTNFNSENVTNMNRMFNKCSKLPSLDVSNFNTKKVTNMSFMFSYCSTLTTIYVNDKFVIDKVTNGSYMFDNCTNLKDYAPSKKDHNYANYKTGYFTKLVGKNGDEKIGATGEPLATDNLVLDDDKDFVAYEKFAAKDASYSRTMNAGTTWGTLCLPFGIDQSQETGCKFYRLTGIDNDNDCITLESYEEGAKIPAGTPVLFKMNEGEQTLSISAQDAGIVTEPKAGTNTDVNLVGSFTKIGGKDNQGLTDTDYIIGKDKFWLVSELKKDGNSKGVGIKPMRAYIHPATASHARAAMLSIGKGDGTTAIDNLNAISNDANAEYYDANGRRTNGLQKGLNIVKRGSKTYKIMVK